MPPLLLPSPFFVLTDVFPVHAFAYDVMLMMSMMMIVFNEQQQQQRRQTLCSKVLSWSDKFCLFMVTSAVAHGPVGLTIASSVTTSNTYVIIHQAGLYHLSQKVILIRAIQEVDQNLPNTCAPCQDTASRACMHSQLHTSGQPGTLPGFLLYLTPRGVLFSFLLLSFSCT